MIIPIIKPGDVYIMTKPILRHIKIINVFEKKAKVKILNHGLTNLIGMFDVYEIDYINKKMSKVETL